MMLKLWPVKQLSDKVQAAARWASGRRTPSEKSGLEGSTASLSKPPHRTLQKERFWSVVESGTSEAIPEGRDGLGGPEHRVMPKV